MELTGDKDKRYTQIVTIEKKVGILFDYSLN